MSDRESQILASGELDMDVIRQATELVPAEGTITSVDQVTNAEMLEAYNAAAAESAKISEKVDDLVTFVDAHASFIKRRDTVECFDGTEIWYQKERASTLYCVASCQVIPSLSEFIVPSQTDPVNEAMKMGASPSKLVHSVLSDTLLKYLVLGEEVPKSGFKSMLGVDQDGKEVAMNQPANVVKGALLVVDMLTDPEQLELLNQIPDPAAAEEVARKIEKAYMLLSNEVTTDPISFRDLGEALQELITPAAIGYMHVSALRTAMDSRKKVLGQLSYNTGVDEGVQQIFLDRLGLDNGSRLLGIYEAANTLALCHMPNYVEEAVGGEFEFKAYLRDFFQLTNISDEQLKDKWLSQIETIPAEARQLFASIETVYILGRTGNKYDKVLAFLHRMNGGYKKLMNDAYDELAPSLVSANTKFYAELAKQLLTQSDGASVEQVVRMIQEAEFLEQLYIDVKMRPLAEKFSERGMLQPGDFADSLVDHHFSAVLDSLTSRFQLDEIERFCEDKMAEIARVEEPYHYNSDRIRSFENGPKALKVIREDLEAHGIAPSEEIIRTLALLTLQSLHAPDAQAYFDKLGADQLTINNLLSEMNFLGQERHATLTDALNWIDELIETGEESKVRQPQLRRFIEQYYIGPDPIDPEEAVKEEAEQQAEEATAVEAEPVVEVTDVEEEPEEPLVEAEPVVEPKPEIEVELVQEEPEPKPKPRQSNKPEAMRQFLDVLGNILDDVEIGFADVDAFPPGTRELQAQHRRREIHGQRDVALNIDPRRAEGIVGLKKALEERGLSARLELTNFTRWSQLPYFALYVQTHPDDKTGLCIMENVLYGTGTYAFTVDGELIQNWEEMAALKRQEARDDFGAHSFWHPDSGASNYAMHYQKLEAFALTQLKRVNSPAA